MTRKDRGLHRKFPLVVALGLLLQTVGLQPAAAQPQGTLTQIWTYSPVALWSVLGGKGPALADLDSDGHQEIVIGSWGIEILNSNGTLRQSISTRAHIRGTPALADLDKDGQLEIIAVTEQYGENWLQVFHSNGSLYWEKRLDSRDLNHDGVNDSDGNRDNCLDSSNVCISVYDARYLAPNPPHPDWQIGECANGSSNDCGISPRSGEIEYPHFSPTVGDVDGDGWPEVFQGVSIRYNLSNFANSPSNPTGPQEVGNVTESYDGLVYGWNHDGSNLAGWPFYDHFLIGSSPALGDVDGDGLPDVVFHSDADRIYAVRHDGSVIPGWGHGFSGQVRGTPVGVNPALADMNGDGRDEVMMTSWVNPDFTNPEQVSGFQIFDPHGIRIAGTPIEWVGYGDEIAETYHAYAPELTPAVVDVDSDGSLEVITPGTDKRMHFFQWEGTQFVERNGWPKSLGDAMAAEAVVGDVDRDGQVDVVVTTFDHKKQNRGGHIIAWRLDGTLIFDQFVSSMNGFKGPAALGDIDQDGNLEIIVSGEDGVVRAYRYAGGGNASFQVLWSQHQGNAAHTGHLQPLPAQQPRGLQAEAFSDSIHLAWRVGNAVDISGYHVERKPLDSGYVRLTGSIPLSSPFYWDTGLSNGTLYTYRVIAVLGSGGEVASAPFAVQTQPYSNLVVNPGFESRLDHWDYVYADWPPGWSLPIEDTSIYHQGQRSLRFDLNNPTTALQRPRQYRPYFAPQADRYIKLLSGEEYLLEAYVRAINLNGTPRVKVRVANVYDNLQYYDTPHASLVNGSTNGWQRLSVSFTAPDWLSEATVYPVVLLNGATQGTIWFDDITLRSTTPKTIIPLSAGWNLISLPVEPISTSAADLFNSSTPVGSVTGIWAYDTSDCNSPTWHTYPGDLTTISPTMGLWVLANQPAQLSVTGTPTAAISVPLCSGWNLTGFPNNLSQDVTTALVGVPVTQAMGYAGGLWSVWWAEAPHASTLTTFVPGRGYWLYATSSGTWRAGTDGN